MEKLNFEVLNFIKDYFHVYFVERDFEKLKTKFSKHFTVVGTGSHEFGFSPDIAIALYKEDLEEIIDPLKYENLKITPSVINNDLAIVNCTFDIHQDLPVGKLFIPSIRGSFSLMREDENWKILHAHMSIPYKEQESGESYPIQKMRKQFVLLEQMVEDRTKELMQANEQLLANNKTKDKFFSIIAHDLKSPFNSLLGFTELLHNDSNSFDDTEKKGVIESLYRSTRNIYSLTENLLIWARAQTKNIIFDPKPIDLNILVNESKVHLEDIAIKKNITVVNQVKSGLIVVADHFMISTVIRNLLSNAIKFTPDYGHIKVLANMESSTTKNLIKICIEDSGIGIPSDIFPNLFDVGKSISRPGTNRESGTGFGLGICKEFIAYHGTEISARNLPLGGSQFAFTLFRI